MKGNVAYTRVVWPCMRNQLFAVTILAILLSSCWDFNTRPRTNPRKVLGYKPVYSTDPSQFRVQSMAPQPVKVAGKIYVKDNLIYQNDIGWGVHIIDNTVPSAASRIGFIRVLGNSEMSIKGNFMYVNSFSDLVVIDISNWQNVREVKRMPQAFYAGSAGYANFIPLPEHNVYFECPGYYNDKIQTGWVKDSVTVYNCYNP